MNEAKQRNLLQTKIEEREGSDALTYISCNSNGSHLGILSYIDAIDYNVSGLSLHFSGSYDGLDTEADGIIALEAKRNKDFEIIENDELFIFTIHGTDHNGDWEITLKK